jgi:hypothetical protein
MCPEAAIITLSSFRSLGGVGWGGWTNTDNRHTDRTDRTDRWTDTQTDTQTDIPIDDTLAMEEPQRNADLGQIEARPVLTEPAAVRLWGWMVRKEKQYKKARKTGNKKKKDTRKEKKRSDVNR